MFTYLIILSLGIIFGFFLALIITLYLTKINCPKCKQPKPLHQIAIWQWKTRIITGQPCLKCQRPQPQIDISL